MTVARAAAFRVSFPVYDSTTGLLKTGSTPAGTVSKDGGNFAAVTDAPVEIQTSGVYELTLTAAEMTADLVTVKVTAASALAVTLHIQTDTVAAAIATVDDYVDTEVAAILAAVDTEVAAIKAVTDALPNAGALTTIQADLDDLQTRVPAALVGGRMDASVGAVAAGAIAAASFAAGAFDAIFTRALSAVEGGMGFRTLGGAISKLVNRVAASTTTLTVYNTDDTTPLATQTLTRDAAAEPVTEVNTV